MHKQIPNSKTVVPSHSHVFRFLYVPVYLLETDVKFDTTIVPTLIRFVLQLFYFLLCICSDQTPSSKTLLSSPLRFLFYTRCAHTVICEEYCLHIYKVFCSYFFSSHTGEPVCSSSQVLEHFCHQHNACFVLTHRCTCPSETKCARVADDIAISAYVYRCLNAEESTGKEILPPNPEPESNQTANES